MNLTATVPGSPPQNECDGQRDRKTAAWNSQNGQGDRHADRQQK
jgi:hypothetical protein